MGYYIAHNITGHFLEFPSKEELFKSVRYMSAACLFDYHYRHKYGGPDMDPECRGHVIHLNNKADLDHWLLRIWRFYRQGSDNDPKDVTNEYLKRVDEL